ncbi:MAG: ester cyclase [Thermomicrobiales bacterium]
MTIYQRSRRILCPFRNHIVFLVTAQMLSISPAHAAPVDAPAVSIQFFDAVLGAIDLDVAATIVSVDALLHTPDGEFVGPGGAGQFATALQNSFSNVTFVVQEPALAGDLVTMRWAMTGVHTGTYQGLVPIGAPVSLTGLAILRFDEAAIVEQWIVCDRLTLVEQVRSFTPADPCDAECLRPTGNR